MSIEKNILKSWPVASWCELIEAILNHYPQASVYLTGGPDDAETVRAIQQQLVSLSANLNERLVNLYGQTRQLTDLAALLTVGDLLVSVDSAPMHLAVGLNAPVVAIFSPTDEKKLLPERENILVAARDDLPCRPCLWDMRKTSCDSPVCLEVPVSLVFDKVKYVLDH
jgi:ADP-heptose:LPS heptosyltransferase